MEIMGTDETNTVCLSEISLFTDVWGAKRTGISNILVKPIHPKEEIQIVLKTIFGEDCVCIFMQEEQETWGCTDKK